MNRVKLTKMIQFNNALMPSRLMSAVAGHQKAGERECCVCVCVCVWCVCVCVCVCVVCGVCCVVCGVWCVCVSER